MRPGTVYLVGAGAGHPGLLTLRAAECLRRADVVVYDKLVTPGHLEHVRPEAETICVTDLAPCHAERHRPVQQTLIERARQGKTVVRLKGGDPCLFGRGGEEAQALHEAGIPFEIVPGVTAALAAASFCGIPLTHRRYASAVAFLTGHENPDKPESALDWSALARFPGTLVIYMGLSRLDKLARTLVEHGKDPATPAAAIQAASTGEQRTVEAPLADLAGRVKHAGLASPTVVVIGDVVRLRPEVMWFEKLPLFGRRIVVTRPRRQAGELVERLLELGALPFVLPAVEIGEPADWGPVDQALARLEQYHWLVFTSANGVQAFLQRLEHVGKDLRALGRIRLAAIGPKTAEALRRYHLQADVTPARYQSEDLAASLLERIQPGERVLLARADRGREVLRTTLADRCAVEQVTVYSQVDAVPGDHPVLDTLRRGGVDYVILTSSNIARAFLGRLDETSRSRVQSGHTRLASISPVTSAEIRGLGFPVAVEAFRATAEGIVEALVEDAGKRGP